MGQLFAEKKLLVSSGLRNLIYSTVHLGGREPYSAGWFLGHSPFRQWPFSPQSIGCSVQDQKFAHFCSNVQNSLHMMYFHIPIITNGANSHYGFKSSYTEQKLLRSIDSTSSFAQRRKGATHHHQYEMFNL